MRQSNLKGPKVWYFFLLLWSKLCGQNCYPMGNHLSNDSLEVFTAFRMPDFLKIKQRLLKNSVREAEGTLGCTLFGKGLTKDGYGRVRNPFMRGGEVHAHRLMYMAAHELDVLPEKDSTGRILHISHLCHVKVCINPEHLVLEANTTNMERTTCASQRSCTGRHEPRCIF